MDGNAQLATCVVLSSKVTITGFWFHFDQMFKVASVHKATEKMIEIAHQILKKVTNIRT